MELLGGNPPVPASSHSLGVFRTARGRGLTVRKDPLEHPPRQGKKLDAQEALVTWFAPTCCDNRRLLLTGQTEQDLFEFNQIIYSI